MRVWSGPLVYIRGEHQEKDMEDIEDSQISKPFLANHPFCLLKTPLRGLIGKTAPVSAAGSCQPDRDRCGPIGPSSE